MTKESPEYEDIARILKGLSDTDSLKILNQAATGFKSGKAVIKELEITPRKYYRNLKILADINLVRTNENCYTLTPMGRVLHRLLFSNTLGLWNTTKNPMDFLEENGKNKELTVIENYDSLIKFLVHSIDNSKTEILLATKFIDFNVIQSISKALERNIKVNTLNDPKLDYPSFFKLIEGVRRDIRSSIAKFFVNADKNYRLTNIPFSFIIIDCELAIFEVPNKQFKLAFVSSDLQIIKALVELFGELWQDSKSLNVPKW